jgi:hypothetical protein
VGGRRWAGRPVGAEPGGSGSLAEAPVGDPDADPLELGLEPAEIEALAAAGVIGLAAESGTPA